MLSRMGIVGFFLFPVLLQAGDQERMFWSQVAAQRSALSRSAKRVLSLQTLKGSDSDAWSRARGDSELSARILALRLAVLGLLQKGKTTHQIQSRVKNPETVKKEALEFSDGCDQKLAEIFGTPGQVAAGSGLERVPVSGAELFFRFHLFASMHIYSDPTGKSTSVPLYVPQGWDWVKTGDDGTNSSYLLFYPTLGNLKNVVLNIVHLGNPERLLRFGNYVLETNRAGSVRVGSTAGLGGEDQLSQGRFNYSHSHLVIRSLDGMNRFSFVDAFCR